MCFPLKWIACCWLFTGAFLLPAFAQQSLRPSLTGTNSAERQRFPATGYDYNLKLGPAFLKLGATMGFEYNDNINLADSRNPNNKPQSDFIYLPGVNIHTTWPVSELNVLTFDLGLGLQRHFEHPEADQTNVTISPGSQIAFNLYTGPFAFNFHDSFSVQQNPVSQSTLSNTSQYGQISNTAGVTALCDLNRLILQAGIDYNILRYTGNNFNSSDSNSTIFNVSAAIPYTSALTAGLQGNYIHTDYTDPSEPLIDSYSGGPFLTIMATRYTSIQASCGYNYLEYHYKDRRSAVLSAIFLSSPQDSSNGAFYYNLAISNRLNRFFSHQLVAGQERQLGIDTDYLDLEYIRYNAQWTLNSRVTLIPNFFYEIGSQKHALDAEDLSRYGFGLSFSYQLTPHLSGSVYYTFVHKNSSLPFSDYTQNVVGLQLGYDF